VQVQRTEKSRYQGWKIPGTKFEKERGNPAIKDEEVQIPWMLKFRHQRFESPGTSDVKFQVSKSKSPGEKMENSNDSEFCY
jgi:hypothetical protein